MSEAWRNTYDAWKLSGPPEDDEPAEPFSDFEITLTVVIAVKGSDFDPSDFDHDEETFRAALKKEATEGIRHTDMDIGDCWVDMVEPPL